MTRARLAFVFLSLVPLSACEQITTLTVPAESEIEVPGAGILGGNPLVADDVFPGELLSQALEQALTQSFDTAGYDKDAVDSLKLTKLSMTVTEPEERGRQVRGLGFLEVLTISVAAEGVDPVVVAESEPGAFDGDPGPTAYDMPLTGAELKGVFQAADVMELTAEVQPSDPPTFSTTVKFETELTVRVSVVGALNGP